MTESLKKYIKAWLVKAEHDILSAQRLIDIEPMILDTACFHCQQAVEKSLKAYLCYMGKDIQRTHDIMFLLLECANFNPIFSTIDPSSINDYAVLGRYPDSALMPDEFEAKNLYKLAVDVNEIVKKLIIFT